MVHLVCGGWHCCWRLLHFEGGKGEGVLIESYAVNELLDLFSWGLGSMVRGLCVFGNSCPAFSVL